MATFVPDAVLRAQVTAANAMRSDPLPDHWDAILPRANQRAYLRLKAAAFGRGMTAAEFAAFGNGSATDGYDWNLRLGVLFAFREAARSDEDRGQPYQDEIDKLIETLATADLIVGDELWAPGPGNGRISTGEYDTGSDRFLLDEPDGDGRFSLGGGTRL